jgi:plastocyanin
MKNKLFITGLLLAIFYLNTEARQIQVNVLSMSFSPKNFSANIGDTVRFVWVSGPHTTTSTSVPAGALAWNQPIDNSHLTFLYVIKAAGNYTYRCNFHFTMGMVGSFNVPFVAKIISNGQVAVNNCTVTNSIRYKCTLSKPPYKVQLLRYGLAFGSVRTVPDTLNFIYSNLPVGSYVASVKGNNGLDTVGSRSIPNVLVPVPSNAKALHITSTKVTIKWTGYACVKFSTVQFRRKGATVWNKLNTAGNKDSINIAGLGINTKYEFQVAASDSANRIIATGKFSPIDSFKTAVSGAAPFDQDRLISSSDDEAITVFPNPASANLKVQANNKSFATAFLRSIDGKVIWSESNPASLQKGKELNINISKTPAGTYFLRLTDMNNKSTIKKIIVVK